MKSTSSRTIAVINQKGGTGKTTTVVNLGASLAMLDKSVLVVDIDPQAHATIHLGIKPYELPVSVYDVLVRGLPPAEAIVKTNVKGLDLLPSHIDLSGAELELAGVIGREGVLKHALEALPNPYDFILIDCPPSLGLLAVNALNVSKEVVIPIQAEFFALEGVGKLLNTIRVVKERLNPELAVTGVVLTMFDSRKNLCQDVAEKVARHFEKEIFETKIRENVKLAEAPGYGMPVTLYDPRSPGSLNYQELAREVLERG